MRAGNGSSCADFRKWHRVGGANYGGAKRNPDESPQSRASAAPHATASSERGEDGSAGADAIGAGKAAPGRSF